MAIALVHTVDKETEEITSTFEVDWDTAIKKYHGKRIDDNKFYYVSMKGGRIPPYKYKKKILKDVIPKAKS